MRCAGLAKYEHQHKAIVWRVPRLPKPGQGWAQNEPPFSRYCCRKKNRNLRDNESYQVGQPYQLIRVNLCRILMKYSISLTHFQHFSFENCK